MHFDKGLFAARAICRVDSTGVDENENGNAGGRLVIDLHMPVDTVSVKKMLKIKLEAEANNGNLVVEPIDMWRYRLRWRSLVCAEAISVKHMSIEPAEPIRRGRRDDVDGDIGDDDGGDDDNDDNGDGRGRRADPPPLGDADRRDGNNGNGGGDLSNTTRAGKRMVFWPPTSDRVFILHIKPPLRTEVFILQRL